MNTKDSSPRLLTDLPANLLPVDYDIHEEKHAYFVEMMELIILEISSARAAGPISILELGAGSGLMTRRLLQIRDAAVTAVEADPGHFARLRQKFEFIVNLSLLNQDSESLSPRGRFDFIVSSFSDHHIHPDQRLNYLNKVKSLLRPGGHFLCGDEFLRSHQFRDQRARHQAIIDYHMHIIEIAKQQDESVLVELETASLISGLQDLGDYKVSCDQYENALLKADFEFRCRKIGPLNRSDVGGVYVYVARAHQR